MRPPSWLRSESSPRETSACAGDVGRGGARLTGPSRAPDSLAVLVPGERERAAGAGVERDVPVAAGRHCFVDARLERERRLHEAERLAHLLIAEAPVDLVVARIFELAAEAQARRAGEID